MTGAQGSCLFRALKAHALGALLSLLSTAQATGSRSQARSRAPGRPGCASPTRCRTSCTSPPALQHPLHPRRPPLPARDEPAPPQPRTPHPQRPLAQSRRRPPPPRAQPPRRTRPPSCPLLHQPQPPRPPPPPPPHAPVTLAPTTRTFTRATMPPAPPPPARRRLPTLSPRRRQHQAPVGPPAASSQAPRRRLAAGQTSQPRCPRRRAPGPSSRLSSQAALTARRALGRRHHLRLGTRRLPPGRFYHRSSSRRGRCAASRSRWTCGRSRPRATCRWARARPTCAPRCRQSSSVRAEQGPLLERDLSMEQTHFHPPGAAWRPWQSCTHARARAAA